MIRLRKGEDAFQDAMSRVYGVNTRNITFQVTDSCNLKCSYCYQINKGHRHMSFETAKKAVDLIFSGEKGMAEYLGEHGAYIFEFIGGEPFLEIDLIDQICDYIKEIIYLKHPELVSKYRFSICSNGLLYFDPKVQKFLNKHINDLGFNISIDGNKKLHDMCRRQPNGEPSYDIAMAGVNHWRSQGKFMGSKMTLAPANVEYTYEATKDMIESGYDIVQLNCCYEEGWTKEHATTLYHELIKVADYMLEMEHPEKIYFAFWSNEMRDYCPMPLDIEDNDKNWCGGNGQMLSIDPDGRFFPCIRYMESSLGTDQKPLEIGNVDIGIGQRACDKDCLNCLANVTRTSQSTQTCIDCPIAGGCGWCSGYNYQRYGTLNKRATFICDMHKAQALANVYYINKLNRKFNDPDRFPMHCPKEWALEIISEAEYNELLELTKR